MNQRYEVRLSGTGGQGVVLAGIILAEAAGRWREGQYVVQTVSYGPQVRGGLSSVEVVISPDEIDFPKPIQLDFLVPFTQEAAQESASMLKKNGMVLADPELVYHAPAGWVAEIPLTAIARELTGKGQMANIVALGAMAVLTPVIDLDSLEAALKERAPGRLREMFINAARAGARKAEEVKDSIFFEEEASPDD